MYHHLDLVHLVRPASQWNERTVISTFRISTIHLYDLRCVVVPSTIRTNNTIRTICVVVVVVVVYIVLPCVAHIVTSEEESVGFPECVHNSKRTTNIDLP